MNEQLLNVIFNSLILAGYVYLASKQWLEVRRLRSSLTIYRWIILLVYLTALITLIPIYVNQILVLMGEPSEMLRQVSLVLSPVNRGVTLVLLIIFVNYRIKE